MLSMGQIIERYVKTTGKSIAADNQQEANSYNEQIFSELRQMKSETLNLQLSLQRYRGHDLSSAHYAELTQLESQLQISVNKVRARKFELFQQQMENLKRTEALLEKENEEMYNWLVNNHIQKQQHDMEKEFADNHQLTELKLLGQQQQDSIILDQFPFNGEEQPSSVLQLACLPLDQFHQFHLHQSTHHHHQESATGNDPSCSYTFGLGL